MQLARKLLVALKGEFSHDVIVSRRAFRERRLEQFVTLASAVQSGDEARMQHGVEHRLGLPARVFGTDLPPRPELVRAEHDHGFNHVERRRIEWRFGPTRLAQHHFHLRKTAEHHVASLQVVSRLHARRPRDGNRHVHHHPLVERHAQFGRQRLHVLLANQGDQHKAGHSDRASQRRGQRQASQNESCAQHGKQNPAASQGDGAQNERQAQDPDQGSRPVE